MSTKGLALKLGLVNSSKIPVPLPMSVPIHSTTPVTDNLRRSRIPSAEVGTVAHHSRVDAMKKPTVQPRRSSQRLSVQPSVNYNTTSTSVNTVNGGHNSVSSQSVVRRSGQCIHCLRVMSLTVAGRLHSHGPGCPGSGQLPVDGSITNLSQSERNLFIYYNAFIGVPLYILNLSNAQSSVHKNSGLRILVRRQLNELSLFSITYNNVEIKIGRTRGFSIVF